MDKIKILQFGEGVFLRGFVEPLIERMNRASGFHAEVYAVKPRAGAVNPAFAAQHCRYHVLVRGLVQGSRVERLEPVTCLKRVFSSSEDWDQIVQLACDPALQFVFSNTTEAGIEYREGDCNTFPGKLAKLLAARAQAKLPGVTLLPCEFIERNGRRLRECVLAYLACTPAAHDYVATQCVFFDTLVDRIVAGFPPDAEHYAPGDRLLVATEPFAFMAVQAEETLRTRLPFPCDTVTLTPDITPYRMRKVRCLNGSHTAMVAAGLLANFVCVDELLADSAFRKRIETTLYDEILPTVTLPEAEKRAYAASVLERFANPFAHHQLASIVLNSVAKWRVRILPVVLDYQKQSGRLPHYLARSLGELIRLYRERGGNDLPEVTAFFASRPDTDTILAHSNFWGMDLHEVPGLADAVHEVLA